MFTKRLLASIVAATLLGGCSGITGNVPGSGPGWAAITATIERPDGSPAGAGIHVTESQLGGASTVGTTNATSAVNFNVASNASQTWCVTVGNGTTPNPKDAVHTACVTGPLLPESTAQVSVEATAANSSLAYYLPLAQGNTWTFATGGTIVDRGPVTFTCSCPVTGSTIERLDVATPSGAYGGSLYWTKANWPVSGLLLGHHLTNIAATSTDGLTLAPTFYSFDGSFFGVPVIDDTPSAGEAFSMLSIAGTGSGQMTIASIGATQRYGDQFLVNVANTVFSAQNLSVTASMSFAPGVGFAGVSFGGKTTTLQSFSVGAQSQAIARRPAALGGAGLSSGPQSILRALF